MNKYIAIVVTLILIVNIASYTSNQTKEAVTGTNVNFSLLVDSGPQNPSSYSSHMNPDSNCDDVGKPIMLCDEIDLKAQLNVTSDSLEIGLIYAKLAGIYHTRGDEATAVVFYRQAIEFDDVNAKLYREWLNESLVKLGQEQDQSI